MNGRQLANMTLLMVFAAVSMAQTDGGAGCCMGCECTQKPGCLACPQCLWTGTDCELTKGRAADPATTTLQRVASITTTTKKATTTTLNMGKWCRGADVTRDGRVDSEDQGLVADNYARTDCTQKNMRCGYTDIDNDGDVDRQDMGAVNTYLDTRGCIGTIIQRKTTTTQRKTTTTKKTSTTKPAATATTMQRIATTTVTIKPTTTTKTTLQTKTTTSTLARLPTDTNDNRGQNNNQATTTQKKTTTTTKVKTTTTTKTTQETTKVTRSVTTTSRPNYQAHVTSMPVTSTTHATSLVTVTLRTTTVPTTKRTATSTTGTAARPKTTTKMTTSSHRVGTTFVTSSSTSFTLQPSTTQTTTTETTMPPNTDMSTVTTTTSDSPTSTYGSPTSTLEQRTGSNWCSGADTNKDGRVDTTDLLAIKSLNGAKCSKRDFWCDGADTNKDGRVGNEDIHAYQLNSGHDNCDGPRRELTAKKPTKTAKTIAPASCNDGRINQGEEGVDCGGPCKECAEAKVELSVDAPYTIERGQDMTIGVTLISNTPGKFNVTIDMPEEFRTRGKSTQTAQVKTLAEKDIIFVTRSSADAPDGEYTMGIRINDEKGRTVAQGSRRVGIQAPFILSTPIMDLELPTVREAKLRAEYAQEKAFMLINNTTAIAYSNKWLSVAILMTFVGLAYAQAAHNRMQKNT